jgi:hypothetical protein
VRQRTAHISMLRGFLHVECFLCFTSPRYFYSWPDSASFGVLGADYATAYFIPLLKESP